MGFKDREKFFNKLGTGFSLMSDKYVEKGFIILGGGEENLSKD